MSRVIVETGFIGDLTLPLMAARNSYANASYSAPVSTAISARSMQTYSFWQGAEDATLEATPAAPAEIDYVGFYIRDNGGAVIQPQYLLDSVWYPLCDEITLAEDGPYLILRPAFTPEAIRIYITSGTPKFANLKAGKVDILPTGLPIGYQPGALNPEDTLSNIISEGGQILGSNILRTGVTESLSFTDVPESWGHTDWPPLRDALRGRGVPQEAAYYAWLAEDFPDELLYIAMSGQATISYSQGLYLTLDLTMQGPDNGL